MKKEEKVNKVMHEFGRGELKSSSGQKVTSRKQAIAIGLSEAGIAKRVKGRGKNPFFGNSLPFQFGEKDRWFDDDRSMGKCFYD